MGIRLWTERLKAFFGDRRGNVALIFGLSLPVMVLMTVGGVDIHRASTVRVNLQDALDASALAAARSPYTDPADIQRVGMDALRANLTNYPNIILREDKTTFVLNEDQVVVAKGSVDVKALVANIFLPPYGQFMDDYLPVGAYSEVNRSSKNLEVALVLDITGSMSGSRITSLKDAANDLVDMVVQDLQTPYYSKMSIIPYSMGVNLGSYAATARGTPIGPRSISNITWHTGTTSRITAATKANPIVLTTATNHGLAVGDKVAMWDVGGMTALNGVVYTVRSVPTNRTFSLNNAAGNSSIDSRYWSNFSGSAAYVAKCARTDCKPTVTANSHGIPAGGTVYLSGIGGMTQLNGNGFTTTSLNSANTYLLDTVGARTYTSGGSSFCGQYGCQWRVFTSATNSLRWLETSSCVSERTGPNAYTSAYTSNSTSRVGFNYPAHPSNRNANSCPESVLTPLSSSRSSLHTLIDAMTIGGSTAGQIGMAWGWYTVSPSFNAMWPSSSAGALNDPDLLKAVVFMTDGEFNTPYCSGVIASDAASGSGSASDHINCAATNGDPFAQTLALCNAMKAEGIIIYTVGFDVAGGQAANLMASCASGPDYAFLPASGADLSDAFKAIGRDITRLRISK